MKAMRSRCCLSMLAWILKTKPVSLSSSGLTMRVLAGRGKGAGAKSLKASSSSAMPKLLIAEPKKTGVSSRFSLICVVTRVRPGPCAPRLLEEKGGVGPGGDRRLLRTRHRGLRPVADQGGPAGPHRLRREQAPLRAGGGEDQQPLRPLPGHRPVEQRALCWSRLQGHRASRRAPEGVGGGDHRPDLASEARRLRKKYSFEGIHDTYLLDGNTVVSTEYFGNTIILMNLKDFTVERVKLEVDPKIDAGYLARGIFFDGEHYWVGRTPDRGWLMKNPISQIQKFSERGEKIGDPIILDGYYGVFSILAYPE